MTAQNETPEPKSTDDPNVRRMLSAEIAARIVTVPLRSVHPNGVSYMNLLNVGITPALVQNDADRHVAEAAVEITRSVI